MAVGGAKKGGVQVEPTRTGQQLLRLLLEPSWVHRRVERVEFLDDRTIRRHVSVDLTVPRMVGTRRGAAQITIPLTLLKKEPLIAFDVRDDSGHAIPVLTAEQNGRVAYDVLLAAAHAILVALGHQDHIEEVSADLHHVAMRDSDWASRIVDEWGEAEDGPRADLMRYENEEGEREFARLLYDLSRNFILLPVIATAPGTRTVVKFSYVEPFPSDDFVTGEQLSLRKRLQGQLYLVRARLGLAPDPYVIDIPGVGRGGTYHLEVRSPRGLALVDGLMFAWDEWDDDYDGNVRVTPGFMHAHLGALPPTADGTAVAFFRPERAGLLRTGVAAALLTTAILAILARHIHRLESPGASGGSLLLIIPGLVSAYISRPGENLMASYVLFWVRLLVALSGLCAYLAAFFLIVRKGDHGIPGLWWGLIGVAAASSAVLVAAYATGRTALKTTD